MTDLVVFIGIVGLVAVIGVVVGIIVAGRIDRIATAGAAPPPDGAEPTQEDHP